MIKRFRKITPEEKLLNIIERPEQVDKLDVNRKNKKSHFKLRNPLAFFKKIDIKKMSLRNVNKVLLWVSVIVTLAFIIYFIREEKDMRARFGNLREKGIKKGAFQISKKQKDVPDILTYLGETEKNNPFHILPFVKKVKTEVVKKEVDLKLVGIIWTDKPQALIEDKTSKKNYMVYEGDTIDKFKIIKITQNEVKVTTEDGEKILR